MVTKSIYTLHFQVLYTTHYNRIQETFYYYIQNFTGNLSFCDIAKIRFCVLEHIIIVNFIFITPGKHDFYLQHSKMSKTNHLWLTG